MHRPKVRPPARARPTCGPRAGGSKTPQRKWGTKQQNRRRAGRAGRERPPWPPEEPAPHRTGWSYSRFSAEAVPRVIDWSEACDADLFRVVSAIYSACAACTKASGVVLVTYCRDDLDQENKEHLSVIEKQYLSRPLPGREVN